MMASMMRARLSNYSFWLWLFPPSKKYRVKVSIRPLSAKANSLHSS
jgi:hypothetical protein